MTEEKVVLTKHSFKKHEWNSISTKMELVILLKTFQKEFGVIKWNMENIRQFLQIFHYLLLLKQNLEKQFFFLFLNFFL